MVSEHHKNISFKKYVMLIFNYSFFMSFFFQCAMLSLNKRYLNRRDFPYYFILCKTVSVYTEKKSITNLFQ